MQHTLVAVFDNRSDAQNAMDELLASGFSRTDVNVSSADPTGQTDSVTGAVPRVDESEDTGIGASIKNFFTGLFGSDNDDHTERYADAVTRGHHVLTLTTQSEPEVERAADVIERFGPIDLDERHDLNGPASSLDVNMLAAGATAGSSLGRTSSASMQSSQSGSASGSLASDDATRGMASANVGTGDLGSTMNTAPGALQGGADADRNFFQMQNLNDPVPMGTTFQEPMGGNMQIGGSLDSSIGGNTLSATQSSSLNSGLSANAQTSQGGSLSQGDSVLQGTASLPGSDDASLGGTVQTATGGIQGGQSGSMQRDTSGMGSQQRFDRESGRDAGRIGNTRVLSRDINGNSLNGNVGNTGLQVTDDRLPGTTSIDSDWKSDYDSNYASLGGSYDDYAPAYTYGSQMRNSDRYRDRSFDEVQSDLKKDWDARNTGASTWDKFKAAVQRGWDKVTPDIDADDTYRTHWNKQYSNSSDANFKDYEPAYLYGEEARRNQHYRDRDWSDAEADLRDQWNARQSNEPSTWDKFKDAVRSGWDKVTPDMDDDKESGYRGHYDSTYAASGATYDDLEPSYRYGSDKRNDDAYRGKSWDDSEAGLRNEWQNQHGDNGPSAWERVKAAVRHSWDNVTPDDEDSDRHYRNHFSSTYGTSGDTYNDYQPAYRYGDDMRRNDKYRGRDWNDVESDLRSDWDSRYTTGGQSTWDKMKSAVRSGWDRSTS